MNSFLDKVEAVLDYGNKKIEPVVNIVEPYFESFNNEMQPILQRPIDWILFVYFASHIPITIFFDLQCLYPQWLIPQFFVQLNGSYLQLTSDPFMDTSNTIYWFKSFALCEAFIQLPFFFIACHALLKNKSWIRLPLASKLTKKKAYLYLFTNIT